MVNNFKKVYKIIVLATFAAFVSACSSSGDAIDKLFGTNTPILTTQSSKVVSQTDLLKIDVNNVRDGEPGTDEDMTYTCYYDRTPDGIVLQSKRCSEIENSVVTFNSSTGVLEWTPAQHNDNLGEYEIKIAGKNDSGESYQTFNIGVRLKFNGITGVHSITGISAGLNWIGNANAAAYQLFVLNNITGLYELHQTVAGGATTGTTITGLLPNTVYSVRANAVDSLGFLDTNSVATTFITTELVKFTMSTNTLDAPAGTPVNFTIQAFNSDDSPQTIGGLAVTANIDSGTTSGNFSAITDNHNGTYSFTFTPTTIGTPPTIVVATNTTTYFLNNSITLNSRPGPAHAGNSSISSSSNTTTSGNSVEITTQLRDQYNNPISSGIAVTFAMSGAGTSTGTFGAVTNQGNGVYKVNYTGVLAGTAKDIVPVIDGTPLAISTPVSVTPGVVSSLTSTIGVSSSTVASGTDATVTATLKDAAGNLIPSGVLVTFNKNGGSSTGIFGSVTNHSNGTYTTTYTGVLVGSAQTLTVSVDGQALTPTALIAVVPGVPHAANSSLNLSASTVISGNFITATATIKDINNNPIETGITVDFVKSGGTSTGTFNAVTNQGNGVYTIRYTGVVSGTAQDIQIQIGGTNFLTPSQVTVLHAAPDATNSTIATNNATIQSGSTATITATLRDLNNNLVVSGYAVTFSKSGGTSTGVFGSFDNNGDGTYTTTYEGVVAGSPQTIAVLVNGFILGPTLTETVTYGAPSLANSSFNLSTATVVSGLSSTGTIIIRDANNNNIDSGITVTVNKSGGTSTGTLSAVTNNGSGNYSFTYSGIVAGTAQTLQVQVDAVNFLASKTITVVNAAPSAANSSIITNFATIQSGSSATITATVKDLNNNPITSGYSITFSKSGGTSTGTFSGVTNNMDGTYTVDYTGVIAGTAQTVALLVDGIGLGPTLTETVIPGAPSNILSTLTVSANTITAGTTSTLTATIKDANGNPISAGIVVGFDKFGGTSTGTFSGVTNSGNGVYTATYTGHVAGTAQTVQANVDLAGFGPTQSIQVVVGVPALANSSLGLSANTVASGSAINVNAVLRDSENNPITNQYTITFDAVGGSSTGTLAPTNNGGGGNFSTTYTGIIAGTAQTIRIFYDGIQITGLTDTVTVIPGPVSPGNSSFTIANSSSAIVQSTSNAALAINIRDANSNAISAVGTTITFNKTASVSDGTISAISNDGNGNYSGTYTGTTTGTAQTITLVVDGVSTGMSVTATVTAGPPTKITMTTTPAGILNSIDCNGPYTMTLQDANNNTTFSVSPVTVSLSSVPLNSHTGTVFNDAACATAPVTNLTIPASVTTKTFYYKSYRPQSITLTLAPNLGIASTDVSIENIPVVSWIGSSAQFTMNGSGTQTAYDHTSGGLQTPTDVVISGNYMYVSDTTANRVVKYDIVSNTLVGWIGHIGSNEGISAYDGSNDCGTLNAPLTIGTLTPKWCLGGQSNQITASVLSAPRNLATDGTYLYVASGHRILRFLLSTGAYQGWYGRINNRTGISDDGITPNTGNCYAAGNGATTPQWCYDGTNNASNSDGQFNTISGLMHKSGYLYATDYNNNRIQRIDISGANPVFAGWIGRIGTAAGMTDNGVSGTNCLNAGDGETTPQWCYGGTPQAANRYQLQLTPTETAAPPEGFRNPLGIVSDANYLYVSDGNNYRIVRINRTAGTFAGWIGPVRKSTAINPTTPSYAANSYTTTWTTGGVVSGNSNGMGFNWVEGMFLDEAANTLYLADQNGHRISKISTIDGSGMEWIGRNSSSPTGGNPGCSSTPANGTNPGWCTGGAAGKYGNTNGTFYQPRGVVVTSNKIYVADSINARVQRFNKVNGTFNGWIGAGAVVAQTWEREVQPGTISARSGFDDYSFMENTSGTWHMGIAADPTGTYLYHGDIWNRIKKFNFLNGSIIGYVGVISGFGPTGPAECVGYTSGFTPTWCSGGGRTTSGGGVHGYSNPFSVAADSDYVYVADYSNGRIDRILASDGTYMGWIGRVSTSPTDGESTCNGAPNTGYTPGWCIGGAAGTVSDQTGFSNPRAVYYDVATTSLLATDNSGRLIRLNPSTGAITGVTGGASAGAGGCTITGNVASGWCTTSATGVSTNNYGGINAGSAIASNTNYIFVIDTGRNRIVRFEKVTGSPAGFIGGLSNVTNVNTAADDFTVNSLTTTNGCKSASGALGTPGWCIGNSTAVAPNLVSGTGNSYFNSPRGIWADDTHVFVADTNNHRLMKFNAATGDFVGWKGYIVDNSGMTCLSGTPVKGGITPDWCKGGVSGPGKSLGGFDAPTGLWGDASYVYVIDTRNNRLVTIPR